jgi:hypothetical protein
VARSPAVGRLETAVSGLCALYVFSVPLWFDRLLESIGVTASEVVVPWSRRVLAAPVAATDAAL